MARPDGDANPRRRTVTGIDGVADAVLAGLVVAIVATMIVPLPFVVLDVLLALNLSIAVLLLLVAVYVPEALGIASFPTILLVTTLYRLALDVAAARSILGRADAGEVIRAFGRFVVRGNFVVGAVVFVILTIVQFLVIAKGSERVAEVAARFTLDAMPGKQMAIDAELRAGAIDQAEARRRRRTLARESSFYGAMDGAMKFVKGDAVASIIIAFVNVTGGLAIGVGQRGMDVGEALRRYGLLTIGQGLVAQIPALVVSTAAGILVTRVASEEPGQSLGGEIARQIVAQPRALGIASVLLFGFAITPGMPALPFAVMGIALAAGARAVSSAQRQRARSMESLGTGQGAAARSGGGRDRESEAYRPVLVPIALEVGAALVEHVEGGAGGAEAPLRTLVPAMREALFRELGVPFPGVRVRVSDDALPAGSMRLLVHEIPVAEHEIPADSVLALVSSATLAERGLTGRTAVHPTGGDASWVNVSALAVLDREALPYLPPDEVIVAYLAEALRRAAPQFVGIQETQAMLDALEASHPALVRNVVPKPVPVTLLAEVLRRLAEERVPIRNLRDILEGLAPFAAQERDPLVLADLARQSLRRHLSYALAPSGRLFTWLLSPEVTDAVRESIVRTPGGNYLRLDPRLTDEIRENAAVRMGEGDGVLLADGDVRRYVWVMLEPRLPRVRVISHGELAPGLHVESLGTIGP